MPLLQMLALATIFTSVFAAVSIWLANLYFRITRSAIKHKIPFRARPIARALPLVVVVLTFIWSFFLHSEVSRDLLKGAALISAGLIIAQLLLILMTFLSDECRDRAKKTIEGKAAKIIIVVTIFCAKLYWKLIVWLFRLSASTNTSTKTTNSPFGYFGYESYEDEARRLHGASDPNPDKW